MCTTVMHHGEYGYIKNTPRSFKDHILSTLRCLYIDTHIYTYVYTWVSHKDSKDLQEMVLVVE